MKKISLIIILIIAGIFIISGCSLRESKIGVLDLERVIEESKRAGQLQQELSEVGNTLEQEYMTEESSQENDERKLDQIYNQFLSNKENLQGKLHQELQQVLGEIAEEEGLDVVVLKKYTQFGGFEVTEETITRLDQEFFQE